MFFPVPYYYMAGGVQVDAPDIITLVPTQTLAGTVDGTLFDDGTGFLVGFDLYEKSGNSFIDSTEPVFTSNLMYKYLIVSNGKTAVEINYKTSPYIAQMRWSSQDSQGIWGVPSTFYNVTNANDLEFVINPSGDGGMAMAVDRYDAQTYHWRRYSSWFADATAYSTQYGFIRQTGTLVKKIASPSTVYGAMVYTDNTGLTRFDFIDWSSGTAVKTVPTDTSGFGTISDVFLTDSGVLKTVFPSGIDYVYQTINENGITSMVVVTGLPSMPIFVCGGRYLLANNAGHTFLYPTDGQTGGVVEVGNHITQVSTDFIGYGFDDGQHKFYDLSTILS